MPSRLSLLRRIPRSVRRLASEPLVVTPLFLISIYFIFGGFHYVMISVVIVGILSHFTHRLRKKYGLDNRVDDPTKPDRFYH